MSARKRSFDLELRKKAGSVSRKEASPPLKKRHTHPKLSQRAPKRPLRERRRNAVFQSVWVGGVIVVVIGILCLVFLWRPEVRIQEIILEGDAKFSPMKNLAGEALEGAYLGLVPRDSFFFYPERAMRAVLLETYPEVAAVAIGRSSFTSLTLIPTLRRSAFAWCGVPGSLTAEDSTCYEADVEGLVFAPLATLLTSSEVLRVYAHLESAKENSLYPVKARVIGASMLPEILRFARSIESLGVPVASVAIRDDEVDLFVAPSTRLTYLLGQEKEARENAEAAFPTLTLTDGSIEYVDLRFNGKVYIKRVGE
ncbi:MAG: hypothetical protein WBK28_00360 [Minisyncoccia bacterium]